MLLKSISPSASNTTDSVGDALKITHPPLDAALPMRPQSELPCVLIVEDEAIVAEDLSDQLTDMGYYICGIADNCADALRLAEQHRPQVVMMDIVIKGGVDGIITAEKIARRFQIPVVFATAYSDASTIARAARAAPYGYITKPYQARDVRAAIEVALYKHTLEQRLKESERWFSATLRCVADGVIATNLAGLVQFVNPAAERLLGKKADALLGQPAVDILQFAEREAQPHPLEQLWQQETPEQAEIIFGLCLQQSTGRTLHIDLAAAVIRDEQETCVGTVIALRDISERVTAEQSLKTSEERFRTAFEFAPIGMALVSMEGRFIQYNSALTTLLDLPASQLDQLCLREITHPDDWKHEEFHLRDLLMGSVPCAQFEKRLLHHDGHAINIHASLSLLRKNDIPICYLYQIHDITERKLFEAQILHLAHFDALTGLANRVRLIEAIDQQITAARRSEKNFAVLFCDLDHFKHVNDSLGHEAGDKLLQIIAKRLTETVRDTDTVARLGGDEFVILLHDVQLPEYAARVAHKIKTQIARVVDINGNSVRVGGSVGISLFPGDGNDARTLLRNADSALYEAKSRGRNGVQFYRNELTQKVEEQLHFTTELRDALEQHQFRLYFQPIVNLQTHQVMALEALLRWQHPTLGLLSPNTFLPYAEEAGLMPQLGAWVLHEACRARAAWRAFEPTKVAVSINVSCSQFAGKTLIAALQSALQEYQVDPGDIIIELTEQLMLENTEHNLNILNQMLALGVSIALDDFGVGYSSLSYIVRFAPSKVKIDRSFIATIGESARDDAMVESILALGEKLPMTTIAEGVETQMQLDFLKEKGCQFGQGFFFSKPLPEEELPRLFGVSK